MKNSIDRSQRRSIAPSGWRLCRAAFLGCLFASALTVSLWAAPFDKLLDFTQPDGTQIQLHGRGDEFSARFETLAGYTVVFDQAQKAYCFARQDTDGQLVSTGVQVQRGDPTALGLAKGVRMSDAARKQMVIERYQRWEQGMQIQTRWKALKASANQYYARSGGGTAGGTNGPQSAPPPFTTTGLKVGLTLLIDFSDDPATVLQADIVDFCNGDNYTGFGNNGSVKKYYYDNSDGLLTYTNVVTLYIRVPQPKTYYNDTTKDCGAQGNLLVKDAIDAMKALPNYTTDILPFFDALTVDSENQVVACNAFFAGANSGVWSFGLWPNSWALYNVGAQELSPGGKKVWRYQITDIGSTLSIGTFCHENGHMLCGYPDEYDYDYDSTGGSGNFSLMGYGSFDHDPVQIDAYLKRAAGWATTTDLTYLSSLTATVSAPAGSNFNHFYRFQKPDVSTEYYLVENRQQSGRDALIPASGIAIWHVDELGNKDDQSLDYNTSHANYEITLVQADNLWDFERNVNAGNAQDLYYPGNSASGYVNALTDVTAPSARWWDGSPSGIVFTNFSTSAPEMTFVVGGGGGTASSLAIATNYVFGGNGNGIIEFNECNSLNLVLTNLGTANATGVKATLFTTTLGAAVAQSISEYPDIPGNTEATNLVPFRISTSPTFVCGTPIECSLLLQFDQGVGIYKFSLASGLPGSPVRFDNDVMVTIPSPGSAKSTVVVSNISYALNKATVSLFVTEDVDYALGLELIAPDGTACILSTNNGSFGQNYGIACSPDSQRTTFDDAALTPIASGSAPFFGAFRPTQPLSIFIGKSGTNVNGTWQLRAKDQGHSGTAAIQCWSLFLTPTLCADGGGQCPGADLAVDITAQPDPDVVGNNLTYTIAVTNFGPSTATNVVVTHVLPGTVTFVSASLSQGTYSQQGSLVTFSLGAMAVRGTATLTVVVLPTGPGQVFSSVTATSEQLDPNTVNNSATVTTQINPTSADLAVGMVASPSPVLIGSTLTYTVSLTNNGPSPATVITVTNVLPASASILSATFSRGTATYAGNVIFWSLPGLARGASATAIIAVTPIVQGLITATAAVSAREVDPIMANNTATVTTTVGPAADLALSLTGFPNPVVTGSNVTYTVAVTNRGPSTATGVIVNDFLPAAVAVISTNASQGTLSIVGGTLTWSLGTMSSGGQQATLTIVVHTTTNATLTTSATVAADQADPNPANNSATLTTQVAPPGVAIAVAGATLTAESFLPPNGAIDIGETVTVILRLRNVSNVTTLNLVGTLVATDGVAPASPTSQTYGVLAPSGFPVGRAFTFTASGTNGQTIHPTLQLQDGAITYPPVSFAFTLPTIQHFANPNPILIPNPSAPNPPYPMASGPATPYPSAITVSNFTGMLGKVTVTLSDLNHSYPGDVNVLLVAPSGAKTLVMSHAGDQVGTGLNLTFDDSAAGLLPAAGQLPSGVWQPTAYGPAPGLGGFPSNAPAGPYPTTLSALNGVNPNGSWSLYVFDDSGGDAGAISNGWSLALTSISPVNQIADLGLAAVAAPNPGLVGGTLTYIFIITNGGPNAATSVAFTNVLPTGLTLVSAGASQGNVFTTPASLIVNLGTLNAGAIATVTNVVMVTTVAIPSGVSSAALTNVANVAANETDLSPVNSTISVVTTVIRPVADLALAQTVAPDPVVVGYSLTNTVVITNRGPGTGLSVVLTEPLPPAAGFVAASSSSTVGTIANVGGVITCTLGDLASNATATVVLVLTNSAPGFMTNAVSLSSASTDPVSTNHSAIYVATVVNPAPQIINAGAVLTYESGPVNGAVDPGETVTLSLSLANIGSLDTVNLKATLLPTGGVTSPTAPQYYGALIRGGSSAARSFTFTSSAAPGGVTVATLQLQDQNLGASAPTVVFTFPAPKASSFSSTAAIMIPDHGAGSPYPSTITVAGLTGQVTKATVTLNGFAHSFPHDVSVLLASPAGTDVLVMSHTGGGYAVNNLMLTFDDDASGLLPNSNLLASGTNRPSVYQGPIALPGTGSYGPYQYALSAVNGSDPNGSWSLYVFDDTAGDAGVIASGWTLGLTTAQTIPTPSVPTTLSGVFTNGYFHVTVTCQAGFFYVLQGSTNLTSWASLSTNSNTTGTFTFTDTTTPALQQRFYRTQRQ